jgi:hypothetical protein
MLMERLGDIVAHYGQSEPPQLAAIKRYVDEQYHVSVRAAVSGNAIVVTVPSAALANTLRLQTTQISDVCQLDKRLVFRIG